MVKPKLKNYQEVVFSSVKEDKPINETIRSKALDRAWQIRNFEIELYWKRALYFWGFIALSFTGYIATFESANHTIPLTIACAGCVFSIAWFLVNKASKFWQENWEAHIDCLEDEIEGRLYKTVIKNKAHFLWPLKGYHFSVSKINQAVNLFVILIWIILIGINPFYKETDLLVFLKAYISIQYLLPLLALLTSVLFLLFCRTSFSEEEKLFFPAFKTKFQSLRDCKYKFFDRDIEK